MPRIVIWTSKAVFVALGGTDDDLGVGRQMVMQQLREITANQLAAAGMKMMSDDGIVPITGEGISARWFYFHDSQNEADVEIDIVYSSNEGDFSADHGEKRAIGQAVAEQAQSLVEFENLRVKYGGIWVQPIEGGTYISFEFTAKKLL